MRRDDPDETEGRKLYRELAEGSAWLSRWLAGDRRKAKLVPPESPSPAQEVKP